MKNKKIENGKIYVYTNIKKLEQDGVLKQYIGQTVRTTQERARKGGKGYTKEKTKHDKFANAINKWGWDAFECKILIDGITDYDELLRLEKLFIAMFNTYENGYNSTQGGEGTLGSKHNKGKVFTDEHRRRLSEAKRGKTSHMKGKKHSEETKVKIREARKKQVGEKHPMWGKGNSIYCVELDIVFGSYNEASRYIVEHGGTKTFDRRGLDKAIDKQDKTYKYIYIGNKKIKLHWRKVK